MCHLDAVVGRQRQDVEREERRRWGREAQDCTECRDRMSIPTRDTHTPTHN